eukprot:1143009-Pelagomonas_calceolata.AAC.3
MLPQKTPHGAYLLQDAAASSGMPFLQNCLQGGMSSARCGHEHSGNGMRRRPSCAAAQHQGSGLWKNCQLETTRQSTEGSCPARRAFARNRQATSYTGTFGVLQLACLLQKQPLRFCSGPACDDQACDEQTRMIRALLRLFPVTTRTILLCWTARQGCHSYQAVLLTLQG